MNSKEDSLCWYHASLSRDDAERVLREDGREGAYLVRDSGSSAGDYVLSVFYENEVSHYQIQRHAGDAFFSIEDNVRLHGLDTLIDHYQESSDSIGTQLLCIVKGILPPPESRQLGKTNLLHRAVRENSLKVVSEVLKAGYKHNIDAKTQDGQTAVHLSCQHPNEEILKLLIDAGANVNCRDSRGDTPLHYACRNSNAEMARILLEQRVNIQARNNTTGWVPMHVAARHGNLAVVKLLLNANAPPLPRACDGQFPVDFAREFGHTEVADFLQAYQLPEPKTSKHQWYHGTGDRAFAENLLQEYAKMLLNINESDYNQNPVPTTEDPTAGLYLVRHSKGNNVLTLMFERKPRHFIIRQDAKFYYIDEGPFMPSLDHLVEHFQRFEDGLPINLRTAVKPEPKPPLPLFSTIPRRSKTISSGSQGEAAGGEQQQPENGDRTATAPIPVATTTSPGSLLRPRAPQGQVVSPKRTGLFGRKSSEEMKSPTTPPTGKVSRNLSIPNDYAGSEGGNLMSRISPNFKSLKFSRNKKKKARPEDCEEKLPMDEIPTLMKELSFSTNFLPTTGADVSQLYNVPMNNAAVLEEDYFTASDVVKQQGEEEEEKEEIYFIDKPPSILGAGAADGYEGTQVVAPPPPNTPPPKHTAFPAGVKTTEAGYIVMQSVAVFVEAHEGQRSQQEAPLPPPPLVPPLTPSSMGVDIRYSRTESTISDSEFDPILRRQMSDMSSCTIPEEEHCEDNAEQQQRAEKQKNRPNYFIPLPELVLGSRIGNGEFGNVLQGVLKRIDQTTGEEVGEVPVAIKMLHDEHCKRKNRAEFLREASVMIQLKHHCIVKLLGITKGADDKSILMVQELAPLGSMHDFLVENAATVQPNSDLKLWASQIACGMAYLETQHFVHRDLAARNILLASRHQVKISDFGLSRALPMDTDYYKATQGGKWPIKWYAPESFNYGTFSHASDVWSFGITLWEMFSLGLPPYGEMMGKEVIELIEKGQRLKRPELCPENIFEMMQNCWNYNPKERPTFRHLTEFFSTQPEYTNLIEMIKTEHIG